MSDELENSASASESASASAAPAPTLAGAKPLNEIPGTTLMVDADGIVDAILGAVQSAGMGEAQRKALLASLSASFGAEIAALDARLDALGAHFVNTTGDQTVGGVKTFTSGIQTPSIRNNGGPLVLIANGSVYLDVPNPGQEVVRWGDLGDDPYRIQSLLSAVSSFSMLLGNSTVSELDAKIGDLCRTFGTGRESDVSTIPAFGEIVQFLLGDSDSSGASATENVNRLKTVFANVLQDRLNEILNGSSSIPNNRYAEGYSAGFSAGFAKGVGFGDDSGSGGGDDSGSGGGDDSGSGGGEGGDGDSDNSGSGGGEGGDGDGDDDSYARGYAAGYGEGYSGGYQGGYNDGYADGIAQCSGDDDSGSGCFSDDYLAELEARIRALEEALAKAIALFNALKSFADALNNGELEAPHLELSGEDMVKAFRELVWPTAHS